MDRSIPEPDRVAATRTAADACAALVELGRSLKGWRFYQSDPRALRDLLERVFFVFQGEVGRNGPLALEVRRGTFWLAGSDVAVGTGRIDELARHLAERGVARIAFEAELDADTLGALLDVLAAGPESIASAGGVEAAFYTAPRRGLRINHADWRALARQTAPAPPTAPILAEGVETSLDEHAEPRADAAPEPPSEPGFAADSSFEWSEPRPELAASPDWPAAPDSEPEPIELLDEAEAPPIDADPLDADPTTARALELVERLRELAECDDDRRYRDVARAVAFATQSLVGAGVLDEGYRALCVLAAHAGDDQKRSFAQRETATETLRQLATGVLLDDLVRRACESEGESCLRATSVLREVGLGAAPRVLDRLEAEIDSERQSRLSGALLAMGEEATAALGDAIHAGAPRRQRLAIKLAGETQNPHLVPDLRDALLGGSDAAAREAALALVRIRDVSALDALAEALATARPEVAGFAAYALGSCGRVLAVAPLVDTLTRAVDGGQLALAREVVRALGRLGRPEGVPALAALLARGGLFQRQKLRDLKLAAVNALANVPGAEAADVLARAARRGDGQVRQIAALALRRRAPDASREGSAD